MLRCCGHPDAVCSLAGCPSRTGIVATCRLLVTGLPRVPAVLAPDRTRFGSKRCRWPAFLQPGGPRDPGRAAHPGASRRRRVQEEKAIGCNRHYVRPPPGKAEEAVIRGQAAVAVHMHHGGRPRVRVEEEEAACRVPEPDYVGPARGETALTMQRGKAPPGVEVAHGGS